MPSPNFLSKSEVWVKEIVPSFGPEAGGSFVRVLIEGAGSETVMQCHFGTEDVTAIVVSDREVMCQVPPGKAGTVLVSASSGANATGDGTDARTDSGAPTAFTQTKFDAVMQSIWENGGTPGTCYLSAFQMNKALSFTGNNNQRANVMGADERVVNSLSVYLTPWGQVAFQPSRENRSRDVYIMQDDMWEAAVLRPTKNVALAKTGDATVRQITTELTLVCKNEKASGMIADNTTS